MTKKTGWIIVGKHPVTEALLSGQPIDKVLIDKASNPTDILERCRHLGIPLQKVPKEKLDRLAANHQGVVAFRSQVQYTELEDLIPHLFDQGFTPLLLLLDRITDVGNFGAISRSAEVLGAQGVVFPIRGSAQLNADAIKRSSGALLRIPLCRVRDLKTASRFLKRSGLSIVAADVKGSIPVHSVDFKVPKAVILGSEGQGIEPSLLREADEVVFIPQTGEMDSLNVSVAAGIILYEAQRQRMFL